MVLFTRMISFILIQTKDKKFLFPITKKSKLWAFIPPTLYVARQVNISQISSKITPT